MGVITVLRSGIPGGGGAHKMVAIVFHQEPNAHGATLLILKSR